MTYLFFKVSRLEGGAGGGGGSKSRAENSPYVLSQILAPFEMLLGGIVLGFVSLLVELKKGKKITGRSTGSTKPSLWSTRSRGPFGISGASTRGVVQDSKRPKIHKVVRFESKFENMVWIEHKLEEKI